MGQPDASARIIAGGITIVGLALVWVTIISIVPSQSELTAAASPVSARVPAVTPIPAVSAPAATSTTVSAEPEIDLSIPGVPSVPPPAPGAVVHSQEGQAEPPAAPPQFDPLAARATKLKCEAEIEQLCPDMGEGPGRARCLERRAKDLAPPCRAQLQEQFVRWKEDRSKVLAACQDDARRLCASVRPGEGRMMQCLQEHAQDVSDRCYQTLPKGTIIMRQ